MLEPELKAKWLVGLRDNSHKQGTHRLRHVEDNSFCCLGVLADVIDPNGWKKCDDGDTTVYKEQPPSEANAYSYWRWIQGEQGVIYGLNDIVPELSDSVLSELMNMNDSGKTFAEIADWIENNKEI